MTDPHFPGNDIGGPEREEILSALFAQMVMQQANMAMMLLGKVPHPHTGKTLQDIDGARMFIDQLEMLEAKTRGNLSKDEASLLKQSLMSLRLAFVEAVESPPPSPPAPAPEPAAPAEAASGAATPATPEKPSPTPDPGSGPDVESKKKFSKKY